MVEEFQCTDQTIRMSLIWYNNSKLAHQIRKRAKEFILEEAKKIPTYVRNHNQKNRQTNERSL